MRDKGQVFKSKSKKQKTWKGKCKVRDDFLKKNLKRRKEGNEILKNEVIEGGSLKGKNRSKNWALRKNSEKNVLWCKATITVIWHLLRAMAVKGWNGSQFK